MGLGRLVIAVALGLSAPAGAVELIANGGFESGVLSPWYNTAVYYGTFVPWAVTAAGPHSGGYAATDTGNLELRQDFAGIASSKITSATFWLRHPTGSGLPAYPDLPAYVTFFYAAGSPTGTLVYTTGTGWQEFDVTSTIAPGRILTGFSIYGYSGSVAPNITVLDDVSIRAGVPEPALWTLMIAGFGLVGTTLRRRRAPAAA
jgi:hypothetical protein